MSRRRTLLGSRRFDGLHSEIRMYRERSGWVHAECGALVAKYEPTGAAQSDNWLDLLFDHARAVFQREIEEARKPSWPCVVVAFDVDTAGPFAGAKVVRFRWEAGPNKGEVCTLRSEDAPDLLSVGQKFAMRPGEQAS